MRTHSCSHTHHDGFTLLELLVVMLIATIIAALIPPLISSVVPGVRLRAAAHDLTVALRHTRNQAIIHNSEVAVLLQRHPVQYQIADGKPRPLPHGITLNAEPLAGTGLADTDKQVLWFFPDGSSTGARITLDGGERAYRLQVDWLTGRTQVAEVAHEPP